MYSLLLLCNLFPNDFIKFSIIPWDVLLKFHSVILLLILVDFSGSKKKKTLAISHEQHHQHPFIIVYFTMFCLDNQYKGKTMR